MRRNWSKVRGVNYVPSFGRTNIEHWSGYRPEIVERELSWAAAIGFNSVRTWMNVYSYLKNPRQFKRNLDHYLTHCDKNRLKAMPILMDSCGVERSPKDKLVKAGELYNRMIKASFFKKLPKETRDQTKAMYKSTSHYLAEVKVPFSGNYTTLTWEFWEPNPGYSKLGRWSWPRVDRYIKDVLRTFANDDRVLAWDLMNEPLVATFFPPKQLDFQLIHRFVEHIVEVSRSVKSDVPITVGLSGVEQAISTIRGDTEDFANFFEEVSRLVDVMSFHSYEPPVATYRKIIEKRKAQAKKIRKPLLLTECLTAAPWVYPKNGDESVQLSYLKKALPVTLDAKIGYYQWQLINGYGPFGNTGLLYPSGIWRPTAHYVAEMLGKK